MIRSIARLFFLWSAAFGSGFVVSIFALPWFFQWYETVRGTPLPYEGVLRFAILLVFGILFSMSCVWLFLRGQRRHWLLWWIQCVSFVSLFIVFFGDTTHRLMEEYSWIRYTTSGFLFLASGAAVYLARLYQKEGKTKRFLALFWLLIGGAFLYAGLDELMQIHEAIGAFVARVEGLPSYVTDLVTMTYAVVALGVLVIFFRSFLAEYRERTFFSATFVLGGIVYFFSTMLDTVDIFMGEKLRVLANTFAIDPAFIFSDAWSVLWALKNFFNGLEEVFEHTAASLFFCALFLLVLEKRWPWIRNAYTTSSRGRIAAKSVFFALIITLVAGVSASWPLLDPKSPVVQADMQVTRIAGYFDGLSHTDDLFYHPRWGVLLANEGKGNIYRWNNGRWGMLPDAKKVLRDTDSVTADADYVYVSDGSQGTIFRTDGKGQWEALWTKNDGLKHPEGIVMVDGTLYVIDESEKSMTKLVRGKKSEVWKPSHPLWQAPEGIAYDATTKALVVTDDVTGAVFRVDFGKSVTPFARLQNPEDITVLSDGRIMVTDNGWGAVFMITPDGNVKKLFQFHRSYRDLQGVTVDDAGRVYVVTADGFDRVSFMPSFLFQIIYE
ncbi:MAG: hypothetical protein Q7S16_03925 [bacterium]|nr:hypothetical protein [bacterium]